MKPKFQRLGLVTLLIWVACKVSGQTTYTADERVDPYTADFMFGVNPGYYSGIDKDPSNGHDENIAELAIGKPTAGIAGAGCKSIRPGLFGWFIKLNGLNIRLNAFKYYKTLGMDQITLFLNEPAPQDKDSIVAYKNFKECSPGTPDNHFAGMFRDIYEPIWVNQNGVKSINPANSYAKYVGDIVSVYGPYIDFYEVWNEPDYVSAEVFPKGATADYNVVEKWATRDPHPCELINLYTPIESYIRMMRITWEVVKYYDPTGRVCTGGIGYPNFLDAVLRNTDNPADGVVSGDYPKKGGAYFDILSYHSYPQWQLSYWDNASQSFKYRRYSDAAADSAIVGSKRDYEKVLNKYGYNGTTFPKKHFIITEVNIPRYKPDNQNHIGSPEAQRNFTIKTIVKAMVNDIKQMYFFRIGDSVDETNTTSSGRGSNYGLDVMGMYKNLNATGITAKTAQLSVQGIANKTTSMLLSGSKYDAAQTAALKLPANGTIQGAAFKKGADYIYVLWARTSVDNSENASATYTFPTALGIAELKKSDWDFSTTKTVTKILSTSISLTGTPIFLYGATALGANDELLDENSNIMWTYQDGTDEFTHVYLNLNVRDNVTLEIYNTSGTKVKAIFEAQDIGAGLNTYEIKNDDYEKGLYICKAVGHFGTSISKFVIK